MALPGLPLPAHPHCLPQTHSKSLVNRPNAPLTLPLLAPCFICKRKYRHTHTHPVPELVRVLRTEKAENLELLLGPIPFHTQAHLLMTPGPLHPIKGYNWSLVVSTLHNRLEEPRACTV